MINKNSFFKDATMRICGSLDLEVALGRCLTYLRNVMPADIITIHLNERGLGALRTIARADNNGCKKMDDLIPFSEEARAVLHDMERRDITINNDSSINPLARLVHNYYNEPVCSALVLPLIIDSHMLGGLTLRAFGKNKYTREHADWFLQLKSPFAISLSNALKNQFVLKMNKTLGKGNINYLREQQQFVKDNIIGNSCEWKSVMKMVHLVGHLDSPVLLLGETGVGKEIIADAIHNLSQRKHTPLIKVNCGAIPENLIDSALFGHEKGAFTGATDLRKGFFERADHGTIFLDEIGELPMNAQVRLLRVLQNKEIERVGGTKKINIDTRVITASQPNLNERIRSNQFRADLWFRLNVFPIWIPPLRERKEDIPILARHFIQKKVKELEMENIPDLTPEAIDNLMSYDWPGNVRELENTVERALILGMGNYLDFNSYIPVRVQHEFSILANNKYKPLKLDEVIKSHIQGVLTMTHGKIHGPGGAADILGVNGNTLRNRMKKLGINHKKRDKFYS